MLVMYVSVESRSVLWGMVARAELLTTEIKKLTIPQLDNNGKPYQSKIIGEKELVPYVEDGWEIVRELNNGKFLIKKPNQAV